MENVDVLLTMQPEGYWDLSLDDQGDLAKVQGLETALLMSLFCEVRADPSEIANPVNQRGWWGNLQNDVENYQIGSKLWLLDQARVNYDTANRAEDYAADGLQWMIDDQIADSVDTDANIGNGNSQIYLTIVISRPQDIVLNYTYPLWQGTKLQYGN